jgi:hypothetical protein
MKKLLIALLLVTPLRLHAVDVDFGLLTNQYVSYGSSEIKDENNILEYRGDFLPRITFLLGDNSRLLISAGFALDYKNEKMTFIPELLNTELSLNFGAVGIKIGRINYSDPLGFIATGLFDGLQITHASKNGQLGFGFWYTGFLYKKNANIVMTMIDEEYYNELIDYGNFAQTYFASRRLLAAIDWSHNSLAELLRLQISLITQRDLNYRSSANSKEKLNSSYFSLKMGLPVGNVLFELGGSLEALQPKPSDKDFMLAFAWEAGIYWTLPAKNSSRLSLTGYFYGGQTSDTISAFIPVTTIYYGQIFQPEMPGITVLRLNYSARLAQPLGVSVTAAYFVRNDLITYLNSYLNNNGYFMGGELYASFIWSPVSDVQFNLGGGVFIPSLGDAWAEKVNQWRLDLTAVIALY